MAANATQLPYNFHWERDVSLQLVHVFQIAYPLLSLFTWHPTVLYILIRHPGSLSKEIRAGYIANQICLMINEWFLCWLVRIYPLMPYPALYCDGPLCRLELPQQVVTTLLAAAVILPNPPFEFLLLTMHQKLVANTQSHARLSQRVQKRMMYALCLLLLLNVAGFGVFGGPSPKSEEILNRPELAWLKERGGRLLIFGDMGNAEYFAYECYLIAITLLIAHPAVIVFSVHASYVIHRAKEHTSDSTAVLQRRIMSVFLIQMESVFFFYCLPLGFLVIAIIFNLSSTFLAFARPLMLGCFILNPMPQSLIFLFKNKYYREIIRKQIVRILNCFIPQAHSSVSAQGDAFSQFPSTSITRSIVQPI